jgi:hypothetical protein
MINFHIKKKSNVHGIGIFTKQDIKKGAIFYEVPTDVISNVAKPKWAYIGKNRWVSDVKVLDYINHSCDSNTILDIADDPKLIAKKDIKSGEEITVDYTNTEENGTKIPCTCKTKKCREYFLRIE